MAIPLVYDIFAVDRASRIFDRVSHSMEKNAEESGHLGKAFAKTGAIMATGLAAGTLVAGVAMTKMYEAADQARKVTALTEAVIESTGGVAKVSAGHVDTLATSISRKTGIEDDAIHSGENLLLTFKNIHNEVGRGNSIFDRATKSAVNLSAAGFGDLQSSSKMLGKALNDPVLGLTALSRAGVTFSKGQKDAIKHMVETGHLLKAQRTELAEVESQVGGAAASQATPMMKLKASVHQVSEELGAGLLPIVDRAANWLAGKLPSAMSVVEGAIGKVSDKVSGLAGWFTGSLWPALKAAWSDLLPHLQRAFDSIRDTIAQNKATFVGLGHMITTVILPILGGVAALIIDSLGPAFKGLVWIIKFVVIPVFAVLVSGVIGAFKLILAGAAWAFGWVPKLGPKLKTANAQFGVFADGVNAKLHGILTDVFVTVHVATDVSAQTHAPGFIGPTLAEGQAARGIAGPYGPDATGATAVAAQKKAADAAKKTGDAIGTGLASGLADTAPKVGDAAKKVTTAAQKQLSAFQQAVIGMRDSVRDSVMGFFTLQSEGNPFAGLGAMANKAVKFAHALAKLVKQGVNPAVIAMIAQAGPDVGLRAATELSTAGKANRNRINSAFTTISNAASSAANTVANAQTSDSLGVQKSQLTELREIRKAVTRHHKSNALNAGWSAA